MHSPLLSLAMIVKDGGQLFASLLEQARPWVDEMVIGDTGSRDDSVAIAHQHGAEVLGVPWTDDFAAARNEVLDSCRGRWILIMDADEQLAPADWQSLRSWVEAQDHAQQPVAGVIMTRNYLPGRNHSRGWLPNPEPDPHVLPGGNPAVGFVPTAKVRVFPNRSGIRFEGQLHETVETSLRNQAIPTVPLDIPVHHFGMLPDRCTPGSMEKKNQQYLRLARRKASTHPHLPCAWAELADCAIACGEDDQALMAIDRALVLNPLNPEYRLTAAAIHKEAGQLEAARKHLVTAMNCGPVSGQVAAEIAHLQAQICLLINQPETAGPHLDLALKLVPGHGYFLNTLGAWHLQCGRGQQALVALQRARAQVPGAIDPLLNLVVLFMAAGQPEKAEAHLRQADGLEPDHPRVKAAWSRFEEKYQATC
jgi:Tfp pilus assembly protein PilF